MKVRLLFFASLKDIVGSRDLLFEIAEGSAVQHLLDALEAEYPRLKDYRPVLLTALNEEYASADSVIHDGDEVAIFPPVSGGAS